MGRGSGAGVIFGASGGVMEAALRTAAEKDFRRKLASFEFTDVRGMNGIKEASVNIAGTVYKVAAASGLANANALLTKIKSPAEADYQFIESWPARAAVRAAAASPSNRDDEERAAERGKRLYALDKCSMMRFSHENPEVQTLYREAPWANPGSATGPEEVACSTDHHGWEMPR